MDTMSAYMRALAAEGASTRVFDWDRAAEMIRAHGASQAHAGLQFDWEYTGGQILRDGQPLDENEGCYLASNWAIPELEIEGVRWPCWRYQDETPGWDAHTFWPDSAKRILSDQTVPGECGSTDQ
jgi:hypothetical protein